MLFDLILRRRGMGESFKKIKSKYFKGAIILCVIIGVCAGLIAVGAVMLALKLNKIVINGGFYALIAVGTAGVVGALFFLILRPTDKRVAKRLDRDYALGERVQTMVEFSQSSDDMAVLQRNDTSERLKGMSPKKPALKYMLLSLLIPVMACGLFLSGMMVKNPEVGGNSDIKPEPPVEFDDWQKVRLNTLISNVKASNMEETPKNAVAVVLEGLLTAFWTDDGAKEVTEQVMSETVKAALTAVEGITDGLNSADDFGGLLAPYEGFEGYGNALSQSTEYYKADGTTVVNTFDAVTEQSLLLDDRLAELFDGVFKSLYEKIDSANNVSSAKSKVTEFIGVFDVAYLELSSLDTYDGLFNALTDYKDELKSLSDGMVRIQTKPSLIQRTDAPNTKLISSTVRAVWGQSYNAMMTDYIRYELIDLFKITFDNPDDPDDPDDPGSVKPPEEDNPGGDGDQEHLYGSDEVIYYPVNGEHVKYGTVLGEYSAKANELMESMPDELKGFLKDYFDILSSGLKEEEEK